MKRIAVPFLLIVMVLCAAPVLIHAGDPGYQPLAASTRFVWQNPLPQGNPLNDVDFVGNYGWAVGDNGTVIKTVDGGTSWEQQGPIVPQGESDRAAHVWDVCMVDTNTGYIGSDGSVYKTTDGGAHWAPALGAWSYISDYIPYLSVDFADANNGWFVGNYKIWRTTNGGSTVTQQTLPVGVQPTKVSVGSTVTAYVCSSFVEGYAKTNDGGATWTPQYYTGTDYVNSYTYDIAAAGDSTLYAVAGDALLLTTNGGSSWTTMTVPFDEYDSAAKVFLPDTSGGAAAYVVSEAKKIYKTTNTGLNWAYVGQVTNATAFDAPSESYMYAIAGSRLKMSSDGGANFWAVSSGDASFYTAIDMTTEATGYAVGVQTLAKTVNGGATWTTSSLVGLIMNCANDVFFLPSNPNIGWLACSPGSGGYNTYKTEDAGQTWNPMGSTTTTETKKIFFTDEMNGWMVNDSWGGFWQTTDSGATWTKVEHVGWFRDIDFVDANNGWIGMDNVAGKTPVLHTTDGGSTWTTQTAASNNGAVVALDFVDASTGYVIDSFDGIHKTTNGGTTWTPLTLSPYAATYDLLDVKFSSATDGWIIGEQKTSSMSPSYRHDFAAHTTDGGLTWDFLADPTGSDSGSTGTTVHLEAVDTVNSAAWVVGGNGAILKSRPQGVATITSTGQTLAAYGQSTLVTGTVSGNGSPLPYKGVELWAGSSASTVVKSVVGTTGVDGSFSFTVKPYSATYYKVKFTGDDTYIASSLSNSVKILPVPSVGNAVAPSTMYRTRYYTVYSLLKPRHTSGSYPIKIYKYRYVSGKWKSYGYVTAKAANYSSYTKCSKSIKLPYAGKWKLRAYAPADAGHAAKYSSGYDYVTVR